MLVRSMTSDDQRLEEDSRARRAKSIPLTRLVMVAVTVTGGLAALAIVPPWLVVLTPRWLVRGASITFLWTLLALVILAAPLVLIGGVWSSLTAALAWRRHDVAALRRTLRWVLLASSCLVGLISIELVSQTKNGASQRFPALPSRFAKPANPVLPEFAGGDAARKSSEESRNPASAAADDELYLVVIGESSARGEPYHPWLSIGQVLGWQLERVFPGRKPRIDIRAKGGLSLQQAVVTLSDLERHPDAIIVFAGHNEFQARYGWSRNVRHYMEEGPQSRLALLDLARSASGTTRLILNTLDLYYGETPPPPRGTGKLVDHPTCSPEEYAFLRDEFQFTLDAFTAYCTRIGSVPILIMPGSNDGSFEPSRSVLAGSTPAGARGDFEREFLAVRAAEPDDGKAAITAYRRLAAQHPEFAETHYRLGRQLAAAGAWDEARGHFVLARDLDGLPLRCPTDFREAYRLVARRYGAVLIDGPEVLSRVSPHGILDDHLFHDAQHLNIKGTVALANEVLELLQQLRAFGWPESVPVPRIELEACARHFDLDARKWAEICQRSKSFYDRTAYARFDPSERLEVAKQYGQAGLEFAAGRPLRGPNLPSVSLAASLLQATPAPRAE
jgi:lysophospholipase L1-like esterase